MSSCMTEYRASPAEQQRIADLFALLPSHGYAAIDIGARDCYLARKLAERFEKVVALDLERPEVEHPGIEPIAGNVVRLPFADNQFDAVLCAEVLEHIPGHLLAKACSEIARVAKDKVVIGVPYRQDLRCGRTTCQSCGKSNPPWGHVNCFDENRLKSLFSTLVLERVSFVGTSKASTNPLSAALLDYAGNPFGTWQQEEPCVYCGASIGLPAERSLSQRLATRGAFILNKIQARFVTSRGNWIHVLFSKPPVSTEQSVSSP